MKVITGYIALICFVLLAVKYPLRKLGMNRANGFLMKLHEAASALLLIAAVAHCILALPVLGGSVPALFLNGAAALVLLVWIIAACHMMKDVKKRMNWHRWLSLAAAVAITAHVAAYWIYL